MQVITIGVDRDEILALQKLIELVPKNEESEEYILKVLPFLSNLHASYDEVADHVGQKQPLKRRTNKGEVEQLKIEVSKLRWKISGLMVQSMLSKQHTFLAQQNNTAVAVSLLADPNPVELRCINHGIFKVSPLDIIAIKARGKTKIIYLRKPIAPKMSSTKRSNIEVRSGFDALIKQVQPQVSSFLRVHDSYTINLRCYRLLNPGFFLLKDEFNHNVVDETIHRISTDVKFKVEEFERIMKDIEASDEHIAKFQSSKEGMEIVSKDMEYFNNKYENKSTD
jgi:hypothetical protein